jgi:hypothetical protein
MELPTELIELADELCSQIAEHGKPAVQTIAAALMERDRAATERAANIVESFAWLERRAEIHGETALDIDIIAAAIRSQP